VSYIYKYIQMLTKTKFSLLLLFHLLQLVVCLIEASKCFHPLSLLFNLQVVGDVSDSGHTVYQ
jgi:hypothetical protein